MFLRLLFVLLVALNLAVAAWLMLGGGAARVPVPAQSAVPRLQLASELSAAPPATVALPFEAKAKAKLSRTAPPSFTCLALGPFATTAAQHDARRDLASAVARSRFREEAVQRSLGWWVYLPPLATRNQALAQGQRLAAKDIKDYFVVSTGEQPNSISLGLFKDPGNARKRRNEVVAAGFPARMSERTESVPVYWLDVVLPDARRSRWQALISRLRVGTQRTGCF